MLARFQHGLADIVAVKSPAAARVGRRHCAAVCAEDQAAQQRRTLAPVAVGTGARALLQYGVRPVPERQRNDRRVVAWIGLTLVHRLATIGPILQQLVEIALPEQAAGLAGYALGAQSP